MSSTAVKSKPEASRPRKRWSVWRLVFTGLFLLIAGLVVVAAYLWSERYAYIENGLKDAAAEYGLSLELTINEMTRDEATISDIIIRDPSGEILRAGQVEARYHWRDALEGRFNRIKITEPVLTLTVDETGRPVADWMPAPDPDNADRPLMVLPPEGIFIDKARFNIGSPYGRVSGSGGATILKKDQFSVDVDLSASVLRWGEVSGTLSGPVEFERSGENDTFDADMVVTDWSYRDLAGEKLEISGTGSLEMSVDRLGADGDFDLKALSGNLGIITAEQLSARFTGRALLPRRSDSRIELFGTWSAAGRGLEMPDPQARRRLANGITLNQTLSQTPVAQHFASDITRGMDQLLERGDFTGQGRVDKTQTRTDVFVESPVIWTGKPGRIELSPPENQLIYAFDRTEQQLDLAFDAVFTYPRKLSLSDVRMVIDSQTGRDFQAVSSFSANIRSARTWRTQTRDNKPVRLAPFSINTVYGADTRRHLRMSGAVNYDGDIPGGYATGLIASGDLFVTFNPDMRIRFASGAGRPIEMARFDTVTDWFGEDITFILPSDKAFYRRTGDGRGRLMTRLTDIRSSLSRLDGSQSMQLDIEHSQVEAEITPRRQDWQLINGPVRMMSDNMPSPGTVMTSDTSRLNAILVPEEPVSFTLESPKADVRTQLVTALGLNVQAGGTPDRVVVDYQDGQVTFLAVELPTVPMTGNVVYENAAWTGDAVTQLPKSRTPIDVAYTFEDGVGTAHIDINSLVFRANGLQPQDLIPTLRGKIADVFGPVSAQIDLTFGADQPLTSSGRAQLQGLSFGTLPGPVSGVFADMEFSSFFPPETKGVQSVTLERFDPGFPLEGGEVKFQLIPNGIDIVSARWPIGTGYVSLDPATWVYLAPQNRMTLRVENVALGEFFNRYGNENLRATGDVNGVLPIVISGVNVNVEGGQLLVENGGVIQYVSQQTNAAAAQNPQAEMAFEALKDFTYEELELYMDGPLDGEISLRAKFLGSNPDVLYGSKFLFNVTMTGELLNIARSFRTGPEIFEQIKGELIPGRAQ